VLWIILNHIFISGVTNFLKSSCGGHGLRTMFSDRKSNSKTNFVHCKNEGRVRA